MWISAKFAPTRRGEFAVASDVPLGRVIHTHKAAALLKCAVSSGAVLAGASEADVKRCETYANKIGLAFQVRCARSPRGRPAGRGRLSRHVVLRRWPTTS